MTKNLKPSNQCAKAARTADSILTADQGFPLQGQAYISKAIHPYPQKKQDPDPHPHHVKSGIKVRISIK